MVNNAILFDLDGTLFDSGPDFEYIINKMYASRNKGVIDYTEFRKIISAGSAAMVKHAFNISEKDAEFPLLLSEFRDYYLRFMGQYGTLFPGIKELLDEVDKQGITWGIVTNRLEEYIQSTLLKCGLHQRPACVVAADTTAHRKPHPEPLLHAAELLGYQPEHCYYIGDHMNDIMAAKAAHMPSIVVSWGYHPSLATLEALNPDFIVNTPAEILPIIVQ